MAVSSLRRRRRGEACGRAEAEAPGRCTGRRAAGAGRAGPEIRSRPVEQSASHLGREDRARPSRAHPRVPLQPGLARAPARTSRARGAERRDRRARRSFLLPAALPLAGSFDSTTSSRVDSLTSRSPSAVMTSSRFSSKITSSPSCGRRQAGDPLQAVKSLAQVLVLLLELVRVLRKGSDPTPTS